MLKAAIAGCGLIAAKKFIPIFQRLKSKAKIVGICDLNEKVLREVGMRFRISDAYLDFSKMLEQQEPDIVVVCTPPATHRRLVIEALEKGAHVLVEKPMALSCAECEEMVAASVENDRKLGVMHNQVFNPAFEQACNIVSNGGLGKFLGMRVFLMTSVYDMTTEPDHWAHRLPGGVVGETGPHAVYLSLAFLDHVTDVEVRMKKHLSEYPWSIGDDIRFDLIADNELSSVTLMYGSNQTAAEVDIIGTEGMLKVDLQSRVLVNYNRSTDSPMISAKSIAKSVVGGIYQTATAFAMNGIRHVLWKRLDGHYVGVTRFLDYVLDGTEYRATGQKGKEVVEVMEMVVQKLEEARQPAPETVRA